jgi:O-antigen/teichoic acid export membrane protein
MINIIKKEIAIIKWMVFKINKIAKNFLSIGSANLISQVLVFLIGTYYARILGTSNFGNISVVQAIMVYFTMIALLGLQTFGTREISKNRANASIIVGDILSIRLFVSVACFLLIVIIAFLNNDVVYRTLLILYGLTIFPSALNIDWVFTGTENMHFNAFYNILKNLIPFILILVFLKSSKDINLIPLFTLAGLVLGFLYQIFVYLRIEKLKISFKLNGDKTKAYIKSGFPFLLSGILAMINCNVDRIIIGYTRSSGEAGIYSAAYYIILFLTNVVTVIFLPVFPQLINFFHEKKFEALENLVNGISKVIIMVCVPAAVGGILLSKQIILLLFGRDYYTAYIPFSILMVYILLLFVREVYGYGLNAWNREKIYLNIVAVSSMVNLILNLIFTPKYGMNIAAFITLISEIINIIFMRKYAKAVVNVSTFNHFIKILLPTLAMAIGIVIFNYFNVNVIVNIIVAIGVFFAAVVIFRYFTISEVKSFLIRKSGV